VPLRATTLISGPTKSDHDEISQTSSYAESDEISLTITHIRTLRSYPESCRLMLNHLRQTRYLRLRHMQDLSESQHPLLIGCATEKNNFNQWTHQIRLWRDLSDLCWIRRDLSHNHTSAHLCCLLRTQTSSPFFSEGLSDRETAIGETEILTSVLLTDTLRDQEIDNW
jgi:hypothetical protein